MSEADTPAPPPLLEEDALNLAEKKVLKAFREGWEDGKRLITAHPDGIESIREITARGEFTTKEPTAEDWQGAILRADFLRSLFLGSYDKFAPRAVTISCARIEGRLDLDYCESSFPLRFFWCIFPEGISLQSAVIPELALAKCLVGQIGQPSQFFAEYVKVITHMKLSDGFKTFYQVDLNNANIGGQLNCDKGHFEEGLIAQGLKVGKAVFLRGGFKSNGEVDLNGASIGGQLACDGGHLKKGLMAHNLKTGAGVFLSSGFESNGKVDLNGANIGGQFSCTGGHFREGLSAQRLKVGEDVFLRKGDNLRFESDCKVDLSGANISGQLTCAGGHFKQGLIAQNLKTGEDMFLCDKFESNGKLDLNGANIGGVLDCTGTHFEKGLVVDGLCYQRIELGGDWKKGVDWLGKMPDSKEGFFPQPYEQLMTAYRRMGHPDWAREIGFELEKKRHERSKGRWRAWYSVLKWTIGYGYKPFQSLGWAVGLMMAGFLLFSSGHNGIVSRFVPQYLKTPAFLDNTFLGNEWIPVEVEALESASWTQNRKPPPDYQPFNPMVYSLEAAFPVLPLGQLDKWRPSSLILSGVRWIWTFTGSTLLAILALFGVGALGPNRKNEDDSG
ncbi:MAG: hypothetical protein OXU92_02040 [Deltaproteobacteria bacterium]|nr:hypothetical protein [Deltaproteobacteria bacterium]